MQLSLRPQLAAGAAALVGVSAIALNPVVQQNAPLAGVPAPSTMAVALTGFDSPVTELLATILTGDADNFSISDNLFFGEDAYYGELFYEGILQLPNGDPYDAYVGLIPEFFYSPLPVIRNIGVNASTNIGSLAYELGLSLTTLSEAVWNLPSAAVTATGQLLSGQIGAALSTIYQATVGQLLAATESLITAGLHVGSNVVANITSLVSAIPTLATQWISSTIGGAAALVGTTVGVIENTVTALAGLNLEGAWNAVVDGTVGPGDGSILGSLVNLTIGPGYGYVPGQGVAVPSLRFLTQSTLGTIANALDTPAGIALPAPVLTTPLSAASVKPAAALRAAAEADAAGADAEAGTPDRVAGAGAVADAREAGSSAEADAREAGSSAVADAGSASESPNRAQRGTGAKKEAAKTARGDKSASSR